MFQHLLQYFCKYHLLFYMNNEAVCIHITNIAFSPYFGFTEPYENSNIRDLLRSNIEKPK